MAKFPSPRSGNTPRFPKIKAPKGTVGKAPSVPSKSPAPKTGRSPRKGFMH